MNKTLSIYLLGYSLLLAVLSCLAHHFAPSLARPTLIAGLIGTGLSTVWSLRAFAGKGGKALPILTLMPLAFVLLSQTVTVWSAGGDTPGRRAAAWVITVALLLSIAMLMRIAYSGVLFDQQSSNTTNEAGCSSRTKGR